MIPKTIHYCWFGRNPLPESAQRCIASWRKFLPDYQIVEWNEDNFDVNAIAYTHEAYAATNPSYPHSRRLSPNADEGIAVSELTQHQ